MAGEKVGGAMKPAMVAKAPAAVTQCSAGKESKTTRERDQQQPETERNHR